LTQAIAPADCRMRLAGDAEAPQRAGGDEDQAEDQEGQRLVGGLGCHELRQERQEKQRHLRIEHVGQGALPEDPRERRLAALRGRCRHRT
jgi:hypothetical protein